MGFLQTSEFWYFFIPLIIGIIIYYKGKSIRDEKNHLLHMFKANQKLYKSIIKNLKVFVIDFNAYDAIAFPEKNLTYRNWLEMMTEECNVTLSDELYLKLKNKKHSKPTIQSMTDSLTTQQNALLLIQIDVKLITKKAQEGRV